MAEKSESYTFTVFTPCYNRARFLPRVYKSLEDQTYKDFEWLIVDDGSTDSTKATVDGLRKKASFPVRYKWKPNGGKHTAINLGVKEARGRYFAILDSDDYYKPDALEILLRHWSSIPDGEKNNYKGVCGLQAYESGEIVGSKFPADVFDSDDYEIKTRYRVTGDKISFVRLEVMREYPFPEDLGKFVAESLIWNRMALKYKDRFLNEVIAIFNCQPGGLTDKSRVLHIQNPKAAWLGNLEMVSMKRYMPLGMKMRCCVNYIRYSLHDGIGWREQRQKCPSKIMWVVCYPLGLIKASRDRAAIAEVQTRQER